MNPNTLRARVAFSFKGETHELDTIIDLDRFLGADEVPDFHRMLAQAAGIDSYSYLYEVLESHDIEFSDATGVAAAYCHDGLFDWRGFAREAEEARDWEAARAIAEGILGARDWDADAQLKAALLAVYRAGGERG